MKRPYHSPELKKYQNVETMPSQQRADAEQLLHEAEMEFMKTEDDQNRLNNLKQFQIDLHFVLDKTPLTADARIILSGLLDKIKTQIAELERAM